MKVTLREKKLKNSKRSLYLDFYPPIEIDGKLSRREFLSLYVFEKPKNETEREHNKETRILASSICARRQLELQEGAHGFVSRKRTGDFLQFFTDLAARKKGADGSLSFIWQNALNHFSDFCGGRYTFGQVDRNLCERFREYLSDRPSRKTPGNRLATNTVKNVFARFLSAAKTAYEQKLIQSDPTIGVRRVRAVETKREFFTIDELQRLSATECAAMPEDLRRAALFSALTGLRHSDIKKLLWSEVQHNSEGHFLHLSIQKTGETLYQPMSDEARELLGKAGKPDEKVFPKLKYSVMTSIHLNRWLIAAGIAKNATFHAFRHTFATAQITLGTGIFTVSQMLGHRDVRQTQIYARLLDEKKREAAGKIKLK